MLSSSNFIPCQWPCVQVINYLVNNVRQNKTGGNGINGPWPWPDVIFCSWSGASSFDDELNRLMNIIDRKMLES